MSAQSAKKRFHSITTIIEELRIAGLWLEKETKLDKSADHLKTTSTKEILLLNKLCNILARSRGDDVAAMIIVQQSGAQLLLAQSTLATTSFQAPTVAIEPPSHFEPVLDFVLKHVRNNKKVSFQNHADITAYYLRRIYNPQKGDNPPELEKALVCYVLGMSLPATIERLYTKNGGHPQYVEIFKTQFRKELLGDMTAVFRVEDKQLTDLQSWAEGCLVTIWNRSYYHAALEELEMAEPSSMRFTEKIAAIVHDLLHIFLTRLFVVRMDKLDLETLRAAIQAQLSLAVLLSEVRPFVLAYLQIIDPEKLDQPLSEKGSSCPIIDVVEEEELADSEEDEEKNEIEVKKDGGQAWSGICSSLLKRVALISRSLIYITTNKNNLHPTINRLLNSSSVTAIELGHGDMQTEHWEETVDYLLKDTQDAKRKRLKHNLRSIMCKTASLEFSNVEDGDSTKSKSRKMSKFTGPYHCELAVMALFFKAKSEAQRPEDWSSMMEPSFFQRVRSVKLGLSKPCCLICSYVICRICKTDNLGHVSFSKNRNQVYPCTLPDDLPDEVLSETLLWVEALLRDHLTSSKFQDRLGGHLKSLDLVNDATTSIEANAPMSSKSPRDRRFLFHATTSKEANAPMSPKSPRDRRFLFDTTFF